MAERGLEADSLVKELDERLRAIQAELRPGVAVPTLSFHASEPEPPPEARPEARPEVEPEARPEVQPEARPEVRPGRSGPLSALLGRACPEPASSEPAPPQPESGTPELLEQVKAMTEMQVKLLAASERLIEAFVRIVESPAQPPGLFTPTTPPPRRTEIVAGPFADTEALRQFEQALAQLEGVRRVAVRGYEGSDRAVFDVELSD